MASVDKYVGWCYWYGVLLLRDLAMPSSKDPVINRRKAREYALAHPEWKRKSNREWVAKKRRENPASIKAANDKYRLSLTPEQKAQRAAYQKKWFAEHPGYAIRKQREDHALNPARRMVEQAKMRAKKLGVPFDLDWREIEMPEVCPALGIPLFGGNGGFQDNSPSLDRLKPTLGYVKGNVRVISWRANVIKRDATLEELEAIVAYMRCGGENGMSGL